MISVKVASLSLSNMGFVVLLKGTKDQRTLPVFIGAAEAQAIAIQIDSVQVPRPLTHDLLKNILDCVEWRVKRIEVCDLIDNTFHARILLEHDGVETEVDSRPSDAIALALRCAAPIYVIEKVMDQAGVVLPDKEQQGTPEQQAPEGHAAKHPVTAMEALMAQLEKAVQDERYEDAAKLRDQIKGLQAKHHSN